MKYSNGSVMPSNCCSYFDTAFSDLSNLCHEKNVSNICHETYDTFGLDISFSIQRNVNFPHHCIAKGYRHLFLSEVKKWLGGNI